MPSIKDDRGYNQGFKITNALKIRTKRRCRIITENFDKKKAHALEIGCGMGLHAYFIAKENPDIEVIGTDICEPFIEKASKKYKLKNLRFEVLDFNNRKAVQQLLKKEEQFDYVYGDGILHHLYFQLGSTITKLNNLLKPGGKLLFWEPNICNLYCFLIFKFGYFRKKANLEPGELAFTKKEITKLLQLNKFSDIKIVNADFLLPNTPDFLINFSIATGNLIERVPALNRLSQSIFISARKVK